MNNGPYKVQLTYRALSTAAAASITFGGISLNMTGSFINANVERINNSAANDLQEKAMNWLEANQMSQHWLMSYDNTDHQRGIGQITITLGDRDAALMLKLAMN